MPKIVFLPHQDLLPEGGVFDAAQGETILDVALRNGIDLEHACEKSCACTTASCAKASTRCRKAAKTRTICWIKPGDWSRKAVSVARRG